MADAENEPEVKDVERVEVVPTQDDENVDAEKETPPDSSQEEKTDGEGEPEEGAELEKIVPIKPAAEVKPDQSGELKQLPGETPREFALRIEVTRLKRLNRQERGQEILPPAPAGAKQEMPPERKKVLDKYKPEEVANLREVFDVLAEDMGFVRKDQLGATTYAEKASEELDAFLDKHQEYLPENDAGNVLWDRFKEEYGLYKQPTNPKDFKRIFEKVHTTVFGIQPAGGLKTANAAKEKVKVASHSGASASREGVTGRGSQQQSGARLDMLKGFSDEELADMGG